MKQWKCIECSTVFTTQSDAQPFPMTCENCRTASRASAPHQPRVGTGASIAPQPRQSPPRGQGPGSLSLPPAMPLPPSGRQPMVPLPSPTGNSANQGLGGDPLPLPLPLPAAPPPPEKKVHTSSVTQMMRRTPSRTNLPVTPPAYSPEPPPSGRRRSTSVVGGVVQQADQRAHDRAERSRSGKGTNRAVMFMFLGATVLVIGLGAVILMNMGKPPETNDPAPPSQAATTTDPVTPPVSLPPRTPAGPATGPATSPPPQPAPSGPRDLTPYEQEMLDRKNHPERFATPTPPKPPPPAVTPVTSNRPTERGDLVVRIECGAQTESIVTWSRVKFVTEGDTTFWTWTAQQAAEQFPFLTFQTRQDLGAVAYIRVRYRVSGYSKPDLSLVLADASPALNIWHLPVMPGTQNQWLETEQKVGGLQGNIGEIEFRSSGDADVGMTLSIDWVEIYKAREIGVAPAPAPAQPVPAPAPAPGAAPEAKTFTQPNPANKVVVVPIQAASTPITALQAQALMDTADKGDTARVKALMDANPAYISAREKNGYSVLHAAARKGNIALIRYLLSVGIPVDVPQKFGRTPLQQAAQFGQVAAAQFLLDNGAAINAPDDENQPPLHWAIVNNNTPVVLELLRWGANPNIPNIKENRTALHTAATGDAAVLSALLAAGADPALKDNTGKTPADLAREANLSANVALLQKQAAPPVSSAAAIPAGRELLHLHGSAQDVPNGRWLNATLASEADTTFSSWVQVGKTEIVHLQFEVAPDARIVLGPKIKVKFRMRVSGITGPIGIKFFVRKNGVGDMVYGRLDAAVAAGAQWVVVEGMVTGTTEGTGGLLQTIELRSAPAQTQEGAKIEVDAVDITSAE